MTVMSRDNWAFGAQVITAVGILVIAILSFVNQANSEFRNEIRTELAAIRSEVRDINTSTCPCRRLSARARYRVV